jgi:D-3-phosphoglycerate dehydrogenase
MPPSPPYRPYEPFKNLHYPLQEAVGCHIIEDNPELKMKKIVFTGRRLFMKFGTLEYFSECARKHDLQVIAVHGEDREELKLAVRDAAAVVDIARPIGADIIDAMEQCELILTLSVGYDCVDIKRATERGIPLCNTPAYCTDEVANHAMTLILAVSRRIGMILSHTRTADWEYKYAKPIFNFRDKNFGIIGLGRIGRAIVPKARGFGMHIMAYDPYVDDDIFGLLGVERKYELEDVLREADYISLHTPLTPETRNMINEVTIGFMKRRALVVNTARGHIIDEDVLYRAVKAGRIAGAGLDVLQQEPPKPENPLVTLENCIVTPHIAWYSEESLIRDMEQGMDEVVRVLKGHRPLFVVNPEIFGMR